MNETSLAPALDGRAAADSIGEKAALATAIVDGMEKVIRGKRETLELLVACVIARGHLLIEDLPGLGKTTIAKAFAALVSDGAGSPASFKRVQCTPDLLPYDITGVDVFDPERRAFEFRPGPIFANVVLADELNRTTPKVQSALLEAMAEGQVTVGQASHRLPGFFFVAATQNPIESEGVYPLPAAQLDRFMMRLTVGYPDEKAELSIVNDDPGHRVLSSLRPVATIDEILSLSEAADGLYVSPKLAEAVVDAVRSLRARPELALGPSPRAALALVAAARARALMQGRGFVLGQDLADLAVPVLAHRLRAKELGTELGRIVREETVAAVEKRRS